MNQPTPEQIKQFLDQLVVTLKHYFDRLTDWVTELSWAKFFVFSVVVIIIGGITQDLFSSGEESIIVGKPSRSARANDRDTDIEINSTGIHIKKNKSATDSKAAIAKSDSSSEDKSTDANRDEDQAAADSVVAKAANDAAQTVADAAKANKSDNADKTDNADKKSHGKHHKATPDDDEIHVQLPPGVGDDISNAINEEIANANEHEIATYKKEKSTWLMSLVMISLMALFGIKALMGGKRRAEIKAQSAQQDAEREALNRQVAEAKMQMMQAQIEPHFLFNTLASVEHLIETDPPRASAMQRSLIQYLRAVIPQMRGNAGGTILGREVGIVKEYLTLLKMRMEERLEFTIDIPEGLNSAAFPPMMLQTLVENSIKHGLEPKAEGGTINVTAEVAHNKLRVNVVDNGLGFGAVASKGTGLGLQNIRERLALLYQNNYQFIITPTSPSGVTVTIEIPYQFTNKQ